MNGAGSPANIFVFLSIIPDTRIAPIPKKYALGATQPAPPKIAPAIIAINGTFAPHGINVVVIIGDKELEEELKAVQERNAVVMDKKDGESVEKDNIVTINYSELDDAEKEIDGSKREGFVFTVGTGENIYKIDDEIIGMKKNDTKVITKKYDKKDPNEELAGKTKKISVTVTAIKTRQLPEIDDELAQDVSEKYKTLDDMKKDIMHNMEVAKKRKIAEIKSQSLLEQLVEKNPFEIPASMLAAELDGRWRMMAQQFQTTPEQLEQMILASGQTKENMLTQWTGDSEKMLKSRIIVDSLIKARNVSVTPEEIEAKYAEIAEEGGITVEEVKKHYADPRTKEYERAEAVRRTVQRSKNHKG